MNKKLTYISNSGKTVYCVLSPDKNFDKQLSHDVFGFHAGAGYSAELRDDHIRILDYFHGDTVATLQVLSFEDTNMEVCLHAKEI